MITRESKYKIGGLLISPHFPRFGNGYLIVGVMTTWQSKGDLLWQAKLPVWCLKTKKPSDMSTGSQGYPSAEFAKNILALYLEQEYCVFECN